MTKKEQVEMYMKCTKKELIEMLIQCNKTIDSLSCILDSQPC